MATLLEQFGGAAQLESLIDAHNKKVLSDERLSKFFVGIDITKLAHKQKAFLELAFSDLPPNPTMNLNASHANLRKMGMDDTHIDAIFESLSECLSEFGASPEQITEAIAKLELWRDVVMAR